MFISHWLYPVETLGPGRRLAIWVSGCSRHCKNCGSPELQVKGGTEYKVDEAAGTFNGILSREGLPGITISGGEPFEQADELFLLANALKTQDIAVFSGYTYSELSQLYGRRLEESNIAVLVTGPYIEEMDDNKAMRGSSNQEIIYLSPELKAIYASYMQSSKREQQLFIKEDMAYLAGIPPTGKAKIIREKLGRFRKEGGIAL